MSDLVYDDRIDQIIGTDFKSKIDANDLTEAIKHLSAVPYLFPNLKFYNYDDGTDTQWLLVTIRSEELSEEKLKEIFDDWWEYMHSV